MLERDGNQVRDIVYVAAAKFLPAGAAAVAPVLAAECGKACCGQTADDRGLKGPKLPVPAAVKNKSGEAAFKLRGNGGIALYLAVIRLVANGIQANLAPVRLGRFELGLAEHVLADNQHGRYHPFVESCIGRDVIYSDDM